MDTAHTLDVNGPVNVVDHGGDGPPMLLVHGLGGAHLNWMDVAPELARTHHVWSLDLLGFGRTPLAGRQATISENQHVVDGVIAHISGGRPVVLIGNSMGGLISIIQAARRPATVAALVLVDPALPREYAGRVSVMGTLVLVSVSAPLVGGFVLHQHAARVGAERLVDDTLKLCTVDSHRIAPATREAHIELTSWRLQQEEPHGGFIHAARSLTRYLWSAKTMEHFMDRVTAPTLLMFGDSDRVVATRAGRHAAALHPHWTYHEFVDTGHVPQMERPREFMDALTPWLATHAPGDASPTQLVAATSVK